MAPFGLRAANALETVEENVMAVEAPNVAGLIAFLPTYRHFAVGAVAVGLQSSRDGFYTLFAPDGSLLDGAPTERLALLLDETAANGVAVAVMLLRAGRDGELEDEAAVEAAVRSATAFLGAWGHVWIHALDDVDAEEPFFHPVLAEPIRHAEVLGWIRSEDPDVLAVVGSLGDLAAGPAETAAPVPGSGRPALVFPHPRLDNYDNPGVFLDLDHNRARVDAGATFLAGGYFFWHAAWREQFPSSWHLGRDGTAALPGDLWLLEHFLALSAEGP